MTGPLRVGEWALEAKVGEGTSGYVFRASRADGTLAALKVTRSAEAAARQETLLLARMKRRWGPALLAAGRLDAPLRLPRGERALDEASSGTLEARAWWSATTWTEGDALVVRDVRRSPAERRSLAAIVAHGVGRGLAELHQAGVRHADVKPANILVHPLGAIAVDRADSRGATLVDLDLAAAVADSSIHGGTPRYLAPEVLAGESQSPAADLYALGLVLAEIACPGLADEGALDSARLADAVAKLPDDARELATWILALTARAAGARPSAEWIASQAARLLGLAVDVDERVADRRARVERTYIAVRSARIAAGGRLHASIGGPVRRWLDDAARFVGETSATDEIPPLDALGKARWLVSLVGPAAASWPVPPVDEGELGARLLALAVHASPEAWTLADLEDAKAPLASLQATARGTAKGAALWVELTRRLGAARPDASSLELAEAEVASGRAPETLAVDLAAALLRRGDVGRAHAALVSVGSSDAEAVLLRADVARRRGDVAEAERTARTLLDGDAAASDAARALLARLAWDAADLPRAEALLEGAKGPAAAEVRALIAYARGELERGLGVLDAVMPSVDGGLTRARLEGTRGMLEHARGQALASHGAFARAVEHAVRAGAVVEEATYLTGLAAAAVDAGRVGDALSAATRAALLWERLARPALASRAHLSRAAAFALVGAVHEADLAAGEALRSARASNDPRAGAFARWAIVETRPAGDSRARDEALLAMEELAQSSEEDRVRAAARVLAWANDVSLPTQAFDGRVASLSAAARWEWWGARALGTPSRRVLSEILALLAVSAPIGSRGPTLAAGARLARALGDGEVVLRLDALRRKLRSELEDGALPEHRPALASVAWLDGIAEEDARSSFGTAQVGELEAIVRALSSRDRLKPLLEQVVDTMVLWTGVERGLLLLRAPDDRLVPRAARNLARQDLAGEQLTLSRGLALRAMAERQAICATDAFAQVGDLHASVHALGLRSVLAVPLIARGDVLGVVYLDDRVRRGAFGPGELAWVRLVASQAALAIADARDQALLRRAVRRAERANARLSADLDLREAELATVRAELAGTSDTRFPYEEIAGRSEPMRDMLKLVDRITPSDLPVLIAGESGTGKELVARAIHKNGPRGGRAFVSENCASVPEPLLESTLFGHVRGAFTGAHATRAGLFDIADGGTLFLDEIGEMPLSMQTKLLRVLQDGDVRPVGGERSRTVDVRIIGATHRDLEAMVAAGTFREDLFYRLNVITVRVPALRERAADIPLLVHRFIEKYGEGKKIRVTRLAMDRLVAFPWPGNVRQLENEVRRALVLADGQIDTGELSAEVARGGRAATKDGGLGLKARVDALESELVREALAKTKNNQTRAAEALGISRFGLQKMMRRLGIRTGG